MGGCTMHRAAVGGRPGGAPSGTGCEGGSRPPARQGGAGPPGPPAGRAGTRPSSSLTACCRLRESRSQRVCALRQGRGETGPGRLPQSPASRTEHGLGSPRTRPGPCSLSRGRGHGSRLRLERCRLHSKGHLAFHLPPKDLIKPQIALMRNFAGVRELRLPEKPGPLSGGSLSALSSAG